MTPAGLTPRQRDALRFIQSASVKSDGACPSYREIASGIGLASPSSAHRLVCALEERGYLTRLPGKERSLAVIKREA